MRLKLLLVMLVTLGFTGLQLTSVLGQDAPAVPEILTLPDQIAGGRDVTITVSNMEPADRPELREQWIAQAERFHALYPNVTIEGTEAEYDPAAFTALCAGGELPTLYKTWFTEPAKLIDQGCMADITATLESAGVNGVFNPEVLSLMSQDGKLYGIPANAYALGLAYNIKMLNDAGYDAPAHHMG